MFLGSGLAIVAEDNKEGQLQQPLSKRQQRIAALEGPVGADGTAKGRVRTRHGGLEYLQERASKGQAASWGISKWFISLSDSD